MIDPANAHCYISKFMYLVRTFNFEKRTNFPKFRRLILMLPKRPPPHTIIHHPPHIKPIWWELNLRVCVLYTVCVLSRCQFKVPLVSHHVFYIYMLSAVFKLLTTLQKNLYMFKLFDILFIRNFTQWKKGGDIYVWNSHTLKFFLILRF